MPSLPIKQNRFSATARTVVLLLLSLTLICLFATGRSFADNNQQGSSQQEALSLQASFSGNDWVSPTELISLTVSRALQPTEGTLGVFIGETDVTTLFERSPLKLTYSRQALHLPVGESPLIIFLVSPAGEWSELARFPLRVKDHDAGVTTTPQPISANDNSESKSFEVDPSLSINLKAQSAVLYFPQSERPGRLNSLDVSVQGSLLSKLSNRAFKNQNQFDFVGTTVQSEALRFAEESNDAPQIDLSSYQMQFQVKKLKVSLGQYSYGSNRYLINGFSSRGLNVSVPITSRFDLSFNAVNGTSIVGWNNFSGLEKRNHKIIAGTLGYEVFPEHPGWLRFEAGALRGSRQPLNNYNERTLTDSETSNGFGSRVVATDKSGRLRLEAGYGSSRFDNPVDPLLNQGFSVVPVRETNKNAHYLELSFQVLKDQRVGRDRKANLSFTLRHNRVDPQFRSTAVVTQADRLDNQFELTGNIGDIAATLGHNRLSDNLDDVASILKTLTRRNSLLLSVPLVSLMKVSNEAAQWLPRLSYNYERTHAFGAFLPTNSDFASSHVPDQSSANHAFNADWQRDKFRFGYRFNQSLQDNRQTGRERADFKTIVNSITFGVTPQSRIELNFDLSDERATNLETVRRDRSFRATFTSSLQTTSKSTLAATISSVFAGDTANTNRSRNADLDVQWSWRFKAGNDDYRKVQGQFFIRYANRYARATDDIFLFRNITKLQTMSAGLSFTFF